MNIYKIKPRFQKFLAPITNFLVLKKIHPTIINIFGAVLSIMGGIALFFAFENKALLLLVPFVALIRTALNALDGLVARELNVSNQSFGEVLNEFIDRISDISIFIGIGFANYTNNTLGAVTVIIILLNSYLSILSKAAGGKRQYFGFMGKADRMFYLGIASILLFIVDDLSYANYFLYFVFVGVFITLIQRFVKIKNELTESI